MHHVHHIMHGMATYTDQELLDKARAALAKTYELVALEVNESKKRILMHGIDVQIAAIEKLERKIAASQGNVLKPLTGGNL